jgi:DNA-binding GntR family transcriptional regulator
MSPRLHATLADPEESPLGRALAGESRLRSVYRQLRESIVQGRLAPGSALVEKDLAARLGVSRTPLQGALERLHQEGLIISNDGARLVKYVVAPLTRADGQSLYQIIAELDGLAAHDAALLPAAERRALVERMQELNGRLKRPAPGTRPGTVHELDRAFHHQYIDAAASPRLRAFYQTVEAQEERYARVYFVILAAGATEIFAREHEAIIRAVSRGDAKAAQLAARGNWRNAALRLASAIERIGEQGSW